MAGLQKLELVETLVGDFWVSTLSGYRSRKTSQKRAYASKMANCGRSLARHTNGSFAQIVTFAKSHERPKTDVRVAPHAAAQLSRSRQ